MLHEFPARAEVATETLSGADLNAANTFEAPDAVRLERGETTLGADEGAYCFPPHSLTRLVFRRAG